jgi:hypothetical protein
MNNSVLDDFEFNVGWKRNRSILINNTEYEIVVHIQAYYESDGINEEQKQAYSEYLKNEKSFLERTEKLIDDAIGGSSDFLTPTTLYIDRDGSFAILFDDVNNPDEGIAVCLYPSEKIISQDEFL